MIDELGFDSRGYNRSKAKSQADKIDRIKEKNGLFITLKKIIEQNK